MSNVKHLHDKAMDFADRALVSRMAGDAEFSVKLYRRALDWELKAINEMPERGGLAWDVLHRSAGTLALDCGDYRLAERLACKALAGEPDPEIAEELRELLDAIFERMGRAKKADAA